VVERDAWLLCMEGALDEVIGSRRLRDLLLQMLFNKADWMRNGDAAR
jgi:hemoglobin